MIKLRPTRAKPFALAALLFSPPALWLILQQGLGTLVYLDCAAAGPPWGILGLCAAGACASAAGLSWRKRNTGSDTRRFLMRIASGAALIFSVAAIVMTVALAVLPPCAR